MSKLSRLSDRLRVAYFDQDWGICVGVSERLEEFLEFVDQNQELLEDPTVGPELFDLIFSSMCPLHNANPEDSVLQRFSPLLHLMVDQHPSSYAYWQKFWSDLEKEDGTPVEIRHRLRSLLDH